MGILSEKPWRSVRITHAPTPSMLSAEEKDYLYWVGRDVWQGRGEIVEVGCWLGSSTRQLVRGLRENGHFAGRKLFVFDRFLWNNIFDRALKMKCEKYPEVRQAVQEAGYFKRPLKNQESFLPLFKALCREDMDCIQAEQAAFSASKNEKTSVRSLTWDPARKIEVLFVDAAKTWQALHSMFSIFSESLIPGESLIIAQDYKDPYSYWHVIFFEMFSGFFGAEHVTDIGGTVSFRLKKAFPFPDEVHFPICEDDVGLEEMTELFEGAIRRWQGLGEDHTAVYLRLPFAVMCQRKGRPDLARRQIEYARSNWPPSFERTKGAIDRCVKQYLKQ